MLHPVEDRAALLHKFINVYQSSPNIWSDVDPDPEYIKVRRSALILQIQEMLGVTGWTNKTLDEVRTVNMYFTRVPVKEYVTPEVLRNLGFRWLHDVETWVLNCEDWIDHSQDHYYSTYYLQNSGNFVYTNDSGWWSNDDAVWVEDCDDYYTRRYAENNFYIHSDGEYHESPEDNYDDCGDYLDDYSTCAMQRYGFKQEPNEKVNGVYFGIELELEFTNGGEGSACHDAHENELVLASDGSLDDGGEFKTPPCTYARMMKHEIPNMCRIALENDMEAQSTCGLHIHVSRAPLTELQIAKTRAFLNSGANKDFIFAIAGRWSTDYAYCDPNMGLLDGLREEPNGYQVVNGRRVSKYAKKIKHANRYSALNTGRDSTIEFRLFASTTKKEVIAARLQFVKSLLDYCGPQQSLRTFVHYSNYLTYLKQIGCSKVYPELYEYLVRKEFFQRKPRSQRKEAA